MKALRSIVAAISFAFVLFATPSPALGQGSGNPNPGILPPDASSYGKTYGAWSAAWWQYVSLQPVSSNPLFGGSCNVGQTGRVFFLVGTFGPGSGTANRNCTVPEGMALFFPLVNADDFHVSCSQAPATICDPYDTPQLLWDDLHTVGGSHLGFQVTGLFATIDGVPVSNLDPASSPYRACAGGSTGCAPAFSLTFPANNIFSFIGVPLPAGTYAPAVADGFYLLLAPLPPGAHTIRFGGQGLFNGGGFSQDITYHLAVR